MAEPVKFKISPSVAVFVRPGVSADHKLAGLEQAASLVPVDRITLVYCLMKDPDASVKQAAITAFAELPENVMLMYVESAEAHPSVLDAIAKVHHGGPWVAQALLASDVLSAPARSFLQGRAAAALPVERYETVPADVGVDGNDSVQDLEAAEVVTDSVDDVEGGESAEDAEMPEEEIAEVDEADEAFQSKYKIAMVLGISEKIKMALTGDKEWRSILIKDANKLVSGSVIKNPRITDGEILTILKVGVQNDEIVRLICANKEWTKNYMIRKALIDCPKTPLPNALRYLASLNEKDIANYAKSRNISSVLSTQAKRLTLAKKR